MQYRQGFVGGGERQQRDAVIATETLQLGLTRGEVTAITFTPLRITAFHTKDAPAITDSIATSRRQVRLQWIMDADENHVIVTGKLRQLGRGRRVEGVEIAEQKDEAARLRHTAQAQQRLLQRCGGTLAAFCAFSLAFF